MSELAVERLSHHEATQLTERIKVKVGAIQDNIDHLAALVTRAKNGCANEVLGYKSWTAYIVDVVGSDPLDLTRAERKKLVGFLAAEGMSTRAIAPVIGVGDSTVQRDLSSQSPTAPERGSRPATVTSLDGRERPSTQPDRRLTNIPNLVNITTGEILPPLDPQAEQRRQERAAEDEAEYWRENARLQWNDMLIRAAEFFAYDAERLAGDYNPAKYRTKPLTRELLHQARAGIDALERDIEL